MSDIKTLDGTKAGRIYLIDDNIRLPSVTTILSLNKEYDFTDLITKIGQSKFDDLTNCAARRGSVMHKLLENFLLLYEKELSITDCLSGSIKMVSEDKEFDYIKKDHPKDFKSGYNLFLNFYHQKFWWNIKKILHNELCLWTLFKGGVAGRTDFIFLTKDDCIVLVDFKSSSKIKDIESLINYRMQVSIYMFMFWETFKTAPARGEILISTVENNQIQKIVIELDEMKIHLNKFFELLEQYYNSDKWLAYKNAETK
jgi:hypothetical protein